MTSGGHALAEGGKLFVNSDKETMASITDFCTTQGIPVLVIDESPLGEKTTIIIQKNDCI